MIGRKTDNLGLYYRLVSLWIVCEAFAGGILHAAKIPFTGMIVSSLSVICISMIAFFVPSKTSIIKATIIVASFKLMLSPHSPPTAYVALFFQGYMGQLLFMNRKYFKPAAVALSVLALVESSVQRILVLVLLYGNDFWSAVDQYLKKLTGNNDINYSLSVATGYVIIHAITGLATGIFAVRLITSIEEWSLYNQKFIIYRGEGAEIIVSRKKKKIRYLFIALWLVMLCIVIHTLIDPENSLVPAGKVAGIFFRSVLILLTWYFLLAPLIMKLIRTKVENKSNELKLPMNNIFKLISHTKYIFIKSWELSEQSHGFRRTDLFIKILIMNVLVQPRKEIS